MSEQYNTPSQFLPLTPQYQGYGAPEQYSANSQNPQQAQPGVQPAMQPQYAEEHTQLGHHPAHGPAAYGNQQQAAGQYSPQVPQAQQPYQQQYAQPQAYPQQQQAYPQQQQAYPQQQQAYPQQQVFPQQQQAFPQQQQQAPNRPQVSGPGFSRSTLPSGTAPRLRFIRLVYLHLTLAIFAFTGFSYLLRTNETIYKMISFPIIKFAILGSSYNWGIFLLLFVAVGWVADKWAQKRGSKSVQYMGLGLYVLAEAIIFLPLLYIAELKGAKIMATGGGEVHFVRDAALITLALFGALTLSVFITKKDFSFLRSGLMMATAGSAVLIFLSIGAGFSLGMVFAFAMVILAGGYVLYYTSQILRNYHTDSYVAASLALFSAIALMFWYIIQLVMNMRD